MNFPILRECPSQMLIQLIIITSLVGSKTKKIWVCQFFYYYQKLFLNMKNWQEMKDFSYVGIKLTKAHSISQGLKRCQIQKLSRNNAVYEHLKLHQKYMKMKNCQICKRTSSQKKYKTQIYPLTAPLMRSYATQFIGNLKQDNRSDKISTAKLTKQYSSSDNKLNVVKKEVEKFTKKVQYLTEDLRKTKSTYFKLDSDRAKLEIKYQRGFWQFQVGLNQDIGLTHNELSINKSIFRSSLQHKKIKMKKDQVKIKQINKQIKFPFTQRQMQKIIIQSQKAKQGLEKKQKQLIRSLYDYKSSINYSNRMKTIKKFIDK